ncbi:unnamed protein product [Auanema sp. JU1783]|nr:unnamed protein product [Auanema sp. JU1783]
MWFIPLVSMIISVNYARPPSIQEVFFNDIFNNTSSNTTELPNRVPDYLETKINEVAGISCDMCMNAVYGLNYNVIKLKKSAEDMIRLDCEALFHGQSDDIAQCIRIMVEKIEHYYDKVEPMIETRKVCVLLKMCAEEENNKNIKNQQN